MLEIMLTKLSGGGPILQKLKGSLAEGRRALLIVPDRFTLSYEKAVLDSLGLAGTFDVEVVNFARLADKLTPQNNTYLSAQTAAMLLRKVVEEHKRELKCFGGACAGAGFASEMYGAVSQIRNCGVTADDLKAILPTLPPRTAAKTKDIITVFNAYSEALEAGYVDGTGKIEALAEAIEDSYITERDVYIADFTYFTQVEYRVIGKIIAYCRSCTVSLISSDGKNARIFPAAVQARLCSIASACGEKYVVKRVGDVLVGDFAVVYDGLFSYDAAHGVRGGEVSLMRAATCREETEEVARRIFGLVRRKGCRYKDIAVVCCDFERYAFLLAEAFDNMEIPYFADIKLPLSVEPYASAAMGVIKCEVKNYRRAEMLELLKNPIFALDCGKLCAFENYTLKFGVNFGGFLRPFAFEDETREDAEEMRAFVAALFEAANFGGGSAGDTLDALERAVAFSDMRGAALRLGEEYVAAGLGKEASACMQSVEKFDAITSQCRAMLGACRMSVGELYAVLDAAVAAQSVSVAPMYADCVFVGQNGESNFDGVKYMFIVGAAAGKFPVERGDDGIVSRRESDAWSKSGVVVEPNVEAKNASAKLDALILATRPSNGLTVSCAASSPSGETLLPGAAFVQLSDLLGIEPSRPSSVGALWSIGDYVEFTGARANVTPTLLKLYGLKRRGIAHIDESALDTLFALACEDMGVALVEKLLDGGERDDYIEAPSTGAGGVSSVSRLEKYFKCPFLHFADYILKIKKRDVAGIDASDLGSVMHAVMERLFKECPNASPDDARRRASAIFDDVMASERYRRYMQFPFLNAAINELRERCVFAAATLAERAADSDFEPIFLEAKFGDGEAFAAPEIDCGNGDGVKLRGIIDRVDAWNDRVMVIDYKSRAKVEFTPSHIMYGDRIQLFVYMAALLASGNYKPAGVYYLPLNGKFVKRGDASGRLKLSGFTIADDETLHAVDRTLNEGGASRFFPLRATKSVGGVKIIAAAGGYLVSEESFYSLLRYVFRLLGGARREIEAGYIASSPIDRSGGREADACKYCDYRTVCRIDDFPERIRRAAKLKLEDAERLCGDIDGEDDVCAGGNSAKSRRQI